MCERIERDTSRIGRANAKEGVASHSQPACVSDWALAGGGGRLILVGRAAEGGADERSALKRKRAEAPAEDTAAAALAMGDGAFTG